MMPNSTAFPYLVKLLGLRQVRQLSCRYPHFLLLSLESVLFDYFEQQLHVEAQVNGLFPDVP